MQSTYIVCPKRACCPGHYKMVRNRRSEEYIMNNETKKQEKIKKEAFLAMKYILEDLMITKVYRLFYNQKQLAHGFKEG